MKNEEENKQNEEFRRSYKFIMNTQQNYRFKLLDETNQNQEKEYTGKEYTGSVEMNQWDIPLEVIAKDLRKNYSTDPLINRECLIDYLTIGFHGNVGERSVYLKKEKATQFFKGYDLKVEKICSTKFTIFRNMPGRWVDFRLPHKSLLFAGFNSYVQIDVGTTTVKELKEKIVKSLNLDCRPGMKFSLSTDNFDPSNFIFSTGNMDVLSVDAWIKADASPFTVDDIIIAPQSSDDSQLSWENDVVLSDEHLIRSVYSMVNVPSNLKPEKEREYQLYDLRDVNVKIPTDVLDKKITRDPQVLSNINQKKK